MPYVTLAQLTDRFGQDMLVRLTDRGDVPTGTIDAGVVAEAITDTAAVIDGHVAARYALPMPRVPALLTSLAGAIAIYKLHRHEPDAKIVRDHDAAMRMLSQIGRGDVRLDADGVPPAGTGGSGARTTDRDRPMTAETLRGYV